MIGIRSEVTLHTAHSKKMIVSVSDHEEASRAQFFASGRIPFYVDDDPYKVTIDTATSYMKTGRLQRNLFIIVSNLPLHFRSDEIVEQILSPYCILSCADHTATDLYGKPISAVTARSQSHLTVPPAIILYVDKKNEEPDVQVPAVGRPVLHKFKIFLETQEIRDGTLHQYVPANPHFDVNNEDSLPSCFISDSIFSTRCAPVVLTDDKMVIRLEDPLFTASELISKLETCFSVPYIINPLAERSYVICFDGNSENDCALDAMIQVIFQEEIIHRRITTHAWTPLYGSVMSNGFQTAAVTIQGIPCHFCTPQIVDYILSPHCFVRKHLTAADKTKTVKSYNCFVWCKDTSLMPRHIKVKRLPQYMAEGPLTEENATFFRSFKIALQIRPMSRR